MGTLTSIEAKSIFWHIKKERSMDICSSPKDIACISELSIFSGITAFHARIVYCVHIIAWNNTTSVSLILWSPPIWIPLQVFYHKQKYVYILCNKNWNRRKMFVRIYIQCILKASLAGSFYLWHFCQNFIHLNLHRSKCVNLPRL